MCVCECVYVCVCLVCKETKLGTESDHTQRHMRRQTPQTHTTISTRPQFAISPPTPRRPISLVHLLAPVLVCDLLASTVSSKIYFSVRANLCLLGKCVFMGMDVCVCVCAGV